MPEDRYCIKLELMYMLSISVEVLYVILVDLVMVGRKPALIKVFKRFSMFPCALVEAGNGYKYKLA